MDLLTTSNSYSKPILATTSAPILALAPMAGISDVLFRQICEDYGADYSVTEMASTMPHLINSKQNSKRLLFSAKSKSNVLQIVGNNAEEMALATKIYADLGADIIDINMGCPATNINNQGAGSALLQNLDLVVEIIKKVIAASPVPVTLKTRLGLHSEKITILEVGRIAEDLGIKMLTVHGRTRACRYKGQASYDLIAELKQKVHIPVIANGDIDCASKAKYVLDYTKCDGVMIGRAAVGRPWIFADIKQSLGLGQSQYLYNDKKSEYQERVITITRHVEQIYKLDGESGVRTARKHIKGYLINLVADYSWFADINSEKRRILLTTESQDEQFGLLNEILLAPNFSN